MHAHSLREEAVNQLFPDGEPSLAHLSDSELLRSTRRLVGTSNRLFAELVRELHPLPRVADVMEPLGHELPRTTSNPTWEQWVLRSVRRYGS